MSSEQQVCRSTPGIMVNRIRSSWDSNAFSDCYAIVKVEVGGALKMGPVLKVLKDCRTKRAIVHGFSGKGFHILLDGRDELDAVVSDLNDLLGPESARSVPVDSVPRHTVLNLLAAALPDSILDSDQEDFYSNPEGCLYSVDPSGIKPGRVVSLKFWFSEAEGGFGDVMLEFPAQTFGSLRKVASDPANKEFVQYLVHYRCENCRLRHTGGMGYDKEDGDVFVRKGYKGMPRASIPFFDVSSANKMYQSKMGRVHRIMGKMRRAYRDIGLELDFVRTHEFDANHQSRSTTVVRHFEVKLKELLSGTAVTIVDKAGTPESASASGMIVSAMIASFGITPEISSDIVPGTLNLVVVESSDRDPNHVVRDDVAVQHISVERMVRYLKDEEDKDGEDVSKGFLSTLSVSLSELLTKQGIIDGRDPFYDWFSEDEKLDARTPDHGWTFIDRPRIRQSVEPRSKYVRGPMYCLTLESDGGISCRRYDETPDDPDLGFLWSQFPDDDRDLIGMVTDGEGTFAFRRTDVVTIPEVEKAKANLLAGKNPRNLDVLEESLKACTDVRYTIRHDDCLYFVGVRSKGMESTIHWGSHVYEIRRIDGIGELPETFFDMLQVPFVRFKRLTMVPYPFKYLREYERMLGVEDMMRRYEGESEAEPQEPEEGVTQLILDDFLFDEAGPPSDTLSA